MDTKKHYAPGSYPDLPPPPGTIGIIGWLHKNLFSSVANSILSFVTILFLYWLVTASAGWFLLDAVVDASSRKECRTIDNGACWAVIFKRIGQFVYGFYPHVERWRPDTAFILLIVAVAPLLYPNLPFRRQLFWFSAVYPAVAYFLICGGIFGLPEVGTNKFGGFMLTMIVGVTGIGASLPIGIALALGRQSRLLSVRVISIAFIEFMRGVPLITLLFVASTMLNYFLPPGTTFNLLLRVLIMVTFFASAYMAEVIRGGLAGIPKGQIEAAQASGLTFWKTTYLIVMPQVLKISIPGIVNTFIGLFKDTTLVLIIGMFDVLGMGRSSLADPNWNGLAREIYIFVAIFFFICCYGMSYYSAYLERKLDTENKFQKK